MKIKDYQIAADPGKAFYTKEGVRIGTVLWMSAKRLNPNIVELDEENPLAPENLKALEDRFTALIDAKMDTFAKTRGYSNIITATTYDGDKDPQFALEGKYCKDLRSDIYKLGYALIAEHLSQGKIPTWEEVEARLPEMRWPDQE